jgi:hypothetical protein
MSHSAPRALLLAGLVVAAAACGDKNPAGGENPPEVVPPPPPAAITLLAGTNVADTVDATPGTMLRIGVRGPDGKPAANTVVEVFSVALPNPSADREVLVGPAGGGSFASAADGGTNAQGIIEFRVKMGRRAGPGRVVVRVPSLALTDTARYTIQPGRAKEVRSFPEDTTVVFGGRAPLRLAAYDRYENVRSGDPVTLTVSAGPGGIDGNGVVAGSTLGRVTAVAAVAGLRDSSYVRVVPPLKVVASATSSHSGETAALYTFTLDGSDIRRVHTSIAGAGMNSVMAVAWLGPTKLVYNDTREARSQLYVLDFATGAAGAAFRPAADRLDMETIPRVSRDGNWVYFSGGTPWDHFLYRVRADGTGRELISGHDIGPSEWGADPSPDGTRIVYVREGGGSNDEQLFVQNLATREVARLNLMGVSPRWSPDGTRIAYVGGEPVNGQRLAMVAAADGTGARALSTSRIIGDVEWFDGGKYVIAPSIFAHQLLIIEVATGNELLVPYSGIAGRMVSVLSQP